MGKAKEKAKSSVPSKKYQFYSGGSKSRKECPKCGRGVFMGEYKNPDRMVCGKCGYTEIDGKPFVKGDENVEKKPQHHEKPKHENKAAEEKPKEEVKEEAPTEKKVEEAKASE